MTHPRRFLVAIAAAALAAMPISVAAQAPARAAAAKPAGKPAAVPKTPWGDPDLQGIWTNATTTPLERGGSTPGAVGPLLPEAGDKAELTEEERQALVDKVQGRINQDQAAVDRPGFVVSYNEFWYERGTLGNRTSLVVDPPDGHIPPLTPEGQKRENDIRAQRRAHPADSYLDQSVITRCITRGMPGEMLPGFYNHNYEIVQNKGVIAISVEMIHDVRIIPLDGRPHVNQNVRQWLGDSRGHFEGNTLVVETTNLNDKVFERLTATGFGAGMKMVERFTRIDKDHMDYQFTIEDPKMFTRPWTVDTPMVATKGPIYEYACHEGNYGMANLLSGARAEERKAASKR